MRRSFVVGPLRGGARWVAGLVLILSACGEQQTPLAPPPPDPPPADPPADPTAPARLAFRTQPSDAQLGAVMTPAVEVVIQDAQGNVVTTSSAPVTIALENNPPGAALGGTTTVNASNGIAAFTDLSVDRSSAQYALAAEAPGLARIVSEPFDVVFGMRQVSLGAYHTCGIAMTGVAHCWGDNSYGQLGAPGVGTESASPVAIEGVFAFTTLSAGGIHTCALTADGEAYCWGNNASGQLGDGNALVDRDLPGAVAGGHRFTTLAAAGTHTCGVTTDGDAYCWGYNGSGQLGSAAAGAETDVPVLVDGGHRFATLATGDTHTCGITTEGEGYCWGENFSGTLGDGNAGIDSDVPVLVLGGHTFVGLTAGGEHTCGLANDGAVYCWGANYSGQLGNGELGVNRDTPVSVQGGHAFAALAEGGAENGHTCAVTGDGAAYCWGANGDGQLGDGAPGSDRDTPDLVGGGVSFVTVAAGGGHTCGITAGGTASCWGWNAYGQLGDRNAGVSRSLPVPVSDP